MKLPLVVSFFCIMFATENDKTYENMSELFFGLCGSDYL